MYPFQHVSGDAQRALEEFSSEFDMALAAADPADMWSTRFGLVNNSRALRTTYPVPVSAAGYVRRKGDDKLRSLFERSLSMSPEQWQDGIQEDALVVEAPDFIGWAEEPTRMAVEGRRLANTIIAEALEANANLDFYSDPKEGIVSSRGLFANDHPVNVFNSNFGTFDNDHSEAAIDADFFRNAYTRFRAKKGANGKPLRLQLSDMIVPGNLEQSAKDFLESDLMRLALLEAGANTQGTTNNRYKNAVNLWVADELTQTDKVYLLASNGPRPWILQDGGAPEEIRFDKDSHMYKTTGKIGIKMILTMAGALALPHSIERITLTG